VSLENASSHRETDLLPDPSAENEVNPPGNTGKSGATLSSDTKATGAALQQQTAAAKRKASEGGQGKHGFTLLYLM
jgi:hypothetical protein